jgi:hypothetical protein
VLLGFVAALPGHLDLFVEGSPLGELALAGGLGISF